MKNIIPTILKQHFEKKKKDFPGLSTKWLGQKLSVSQVYISQIFSGKRTLPAQMLEPLCELLDIDSEKREILANELLKIHGWTQTPTKKIRETALDSKSHALDWLNAPTQDFPLLADHTSLMVLEATQLEDFDGSSQFLAQRLSLSVETVEKVLQELTDNGYIKKNKDKMSKAKSLMELQSHAKKEDIVRYHKRALQLAQQTMDERTATSDLEQRLITSSLFTCSREHIPLLRAKLAEFIKEITAEAAQQEPQELYQFGIILFPLTNKQ